MHAFIAKVKRKCVEIAEKNINIIVILLVGSYSRNEEKTDSDIDIMIISNNKLEMIENTNWVLKFGNVKSIIREEWGVVTSLRVFYDEYEIEFGIGNSSWISQPLDKGTERTLKDGYVVIYDRNNQLEKIRRIIKERDLV